MLELLSPAGSPEAVVAAVQNGADAIYLGLDGFNARRGAKNFTREEFIDAVRYCHVRGCKVYVTLNTLVSDRELPLLAELGKFIYENGADAALVQDLGAARVLRSVCPELTLHASTQMSIHTLSGVYAAMQLGMKRVVLARELGMEQIRLIARSSPIELEVFAHGALCFCYSGQCYMSALIGRRSGNRGMCAQPCRLPYSMGRMGGEYPLSLRDNCLVRHLDELREMGVACIKIEGRMKRPEYTAIVTEIYANALRSRAPTEADMRRLETAFSRDGFTDGYYTRSLSEDMFGVHGEPDRQAKKIYDEARKGYADGEARRVEVTFSAKVRRGLPAVLEVRDPEGRRAEAKGDVPEPAQFSPLTLASLSEQLYKTGGTPYACKGVEASIGENLFLPASSVNRLRRLALEALTEKRMTPPARKSGIYPPPLHALPLQQKMQINIQVCSSGQLTEELLALDFSRVCAPLELLCSEPEPFLKAAEAGKELVAVLPRIVDDDEMETVSDMLRRAALLTGVREALVGNLGQIALVRACGYEARGDFGLNVFNSYTLNTLARAGLKSVTASFELRLAQIRDLTKTAPTEIIIYGRLPLMLSRQCIIKPSFGSCDCGAPAQLSDRKGSMFPVMKEFGCRNAIFNAHKLFLADRLADIEDCGLWAGRLLFTTESPRECAEITKAYLGRSEYRPNGLTRGLYYRGVE